MNSYDSLIGAVCGAILALALALASVVMLSVIEKKIDRLDGAPTDCKMVIVARNVDRAIGGGEESVGLTLEPIHVRCSDVRRLQR